LGEKKKVCDERRASIQGEGVGTHIGGFNEKRVWKGKEDVRRRRLTKGKRTHTDWEGKGTVRRGVKKEGKGRSRERVKAHGDAKETARTWLKRSRREGGKKKKNRWGFKSLSIERGRKKRESKKDLIKEQENSMKN